RRLVRTGSLLRRLRGHRVNATGPGHPGYRHRLLHRRFLHPRPAEHLDIHRRDPDVLGQREGQRRAQSPMMSPRAFLGVIGAFTLIGALGWLWNPITLDNTDVGGTPVACGDVFSIKTGNAAVADQRNEVGRALTESRYMYPDREYVTECRDAKRIRRVWAISLAIVGGVLLLGAVPVRRRGCGSAN